jgi:hypothetical protein
LKGFSEHVEFAKDPKRIVWEAVNELQESFNEAVRTKMHKPSAAVLELMQSGHWAAMILDDKPRFDPSVLNARTALFETGQVEPFVEVLKGGSLLFSTRVIQVGSNERLQILAYHDALAVLAFLFKVDVTGEMAYTAVRDGKTPLAEIARSLKELSKHAPEMPVKVAAANVLKKWRVELGKFTKEPAAVTVLSAEGRQGGGPEEQGGGREEAGRCRPCGAPASQLRD